MSELKNETTENENIEKQSCLKQKIKSLDRKRIGKILLWFLVAFFILVVPVLINGAYEYGLRHTPILPTLWDASDALTYYGTILAAAAGAIIGVYFSIKASHKNYREDVRARVLPFIAVTPFERKTVEDPMALFIDETDSITENTAQNGEAGHYEEFILNQIYFIITSGGIEIKTALDKHQQKILSQAGRVWVRTEKGGYALQKKDCHSIPLEIENVGNGTAVTLLIGFNRKKDDPDKREYVRPMMLKQGQTLYIHIFSTEVFEIVNGEYLLEFYYKDIYGNNYVQRFPVTFGKDENENVYQRMKLEGRQTRLKEGEANAHA